MAHYKAEVFLGPNSGYQTVEVNASSINGVSEQIQRLYNVSPEFIRNVREVSVYTDTHEPIDYGYGSLLALIFLVFLFFPTPTLMVATGGLGAWISTKISNKTFSEICEPKNKKLFAIVMLISIFCGGLGYYVGDKIEKDNSGLVK
jgi:hypothetical protein